MCSMVETFLGRFSWNFTSLTYQFISHINPDIFGKWQDISAWNFLICSEITDAYVALALTPLCLLRLGTFPWIVTRDSHQQNFSILNHSRGPPGRGPRPTGWEPLIYRPLHWSLVRNPWLYPGFQNVGALVVMAAAFQLLHISHNSVWGNRAAVCWA